MGDGAARDSLRRVVEESGVIAGTKCADELAIRAALDRALDSGTGQPAEATEAAEAAEAAEAGAEEALGEPPADTANPTGGLTGGLTGGRTDRPPFERDPDEGWQAQPSALSFSALDANDDR